MRPEDKAINWLLEENNPPMRYLTLKNLLKKPKKDLEVQQAKARLMEYEVTQEILKHSAEFWKDDDRAYWKYTGKYWQLIFLGQFMADGNDPRIAEGVHDILNKRKWIMESGGQCLTANLLSALMRLGYGNHPVVIRETESLANRFLGDDGIKCSAMDYSLLSRCYMALPKLLLCFGNIPQEQRSSAVTEAIELITKTLLKHEVYVYVPGNRKEWQKTLERAPKRRDLPEGQTTKDWIKKQRSAFISSRRLGDRVPKKGWLKFGFPLHYNSDILEAMYALAILDTPMSVNLQKPLEVIQGKKTAEGKWIMENSLNGKMWVNVEEKGKPSKWITYFALYVLNHLGRRWA